jgi:hypothetical protein
MKTKLKKLIAKLKKENKTTKVALEEGLSKYLTSRARQTIRMNELFIEELEVLLKLA